MTMIVAWLAFPVLLLILSIGCGFLLEGCAGRRVPGPLIAPIGFAFVVVLAGVFTARGEAAFLASPAVVLVALAGFLLARRSGARDLRRPRRLLDGWATAASLAAFFAYGAPVILSGEPTFTGYVKLDDTATWLAFIDRVMDYGRDLSGLEPSSYRATLEANLPSGYPVGAFLPLGVGAKLTGADAAWLTQPYMATMAGLLALCLYSIATPLLESRPLRAAVAFGASQPALLFAYSLWGGIKEVAVAVAIALLAALAPDAVRAELGWRGVIPAAIAVTALLAMVGTGGLAWITPILALVAFSSWRRRGLRTVAVQAWPLILLVGLLAVPVLFAGGIFSPTQSGLTSDAELGNLIGPLSVFQYVGIWPNGDFRLEPVNEPLATFLVVLALPAAIAGVVLCRRRRVWTPLLYALGTGVGSLAVFAYSSPWVGAKALASGSPSFLLLALGGAAAFTARIDRVLGATVLGLLLAGVLWSNALGYHGVNLAPYEQLRELEAIGEEYEGEGPALMTEYNPYGARHFLRNLDAEGASELRAREVPLREGGELEKGDWGDTDQIELLSLLTYRTLVLRRSPAQSRPPSPYSLVRRGTYYDVWQRPDSDTAFVAVHVPLGSFYDPVAVPTCKEVLDAARLAGPGGVVAAAEGASTVVASLAEAAYPGSWEPTEPGSPDLVPHGVGSAVVRVAVKRADRYGFYLQGNVRNRLTLVVDGRAVGSVEGQLNPAKQFLYFGDLDLEGGMHEVVLVLEGHKLAPGSGGPPEPIGPLVFSPVGNQDPPVRILPSSDAGSLCGRSLDWLEAMP
jgi:hypothetical protein